MPTAGSVLKTAGKFLFILGPFGCRQQGWRLWEGSNGQIKQQIQKELVGSKCGKVIELTKEPVDKAS